MRSPIIKSNSITPSESFLRALCEGTFLTLWSYPSLYRDQGNKTGGEGKELCDLLVVFGKNILIFSDKECHFDESIQEDVAWKRWFKKAVLKSAEQAWGAERWIRQYPDRIFLDRQCKNKLPLEIPKVDDLKFYLIITTQGISSSVYKKFGGSGSMIINSGFKGTEQHNMPFVIGDLNVAKTFVHVLDDDSLLTLMKHRDTVTEFIEYLDKRENLLRNNPRKIIATGEEELLACYLTNANDRGQHDFTFPEIDSVKEKNFDGIFLPEGLWEEFLTSDAKKDQMEKDKISYMWDAIIEKFNYFALRDEQYITPEGGIRHTEIALRFMAREPRFIRRALCISLMDMLQTTDENQTRIRVHPPVLNGDPYYVFVLWPQPKNNDEEELKKYRDFRLNYLESACLVARLRYPDAKDIVGLATESGNNSERSEDIGYLDGRVWDKEIEAEAKERQQHYKILMNPSEIRTSLREYPLFHDKRKTGRNQTCPCGSGKKYKKCCIDKKTIFL